MDSSSGFSEKRPVKANYTQTETPSSAEDSCQIPNKQNREVQTDVHESKENIFAEFDLDSLLDFLKRTTPLVCSVLERNSKSKAFDRYKLLSETDSTSISCLHVLEKSLGDEFCCSSVSWNSVGTAIAAAYSCIDHVNWCEHNSSVDLWSLGRKDFDPKKPNLTLETDCCITYVSFHPELPAVIVAGKLNGEILLWDISKEDDSLLASTEVASFNHREPITGLHWMLQYGKQNRIEFASCSLDGKILLWSYEAGKLKLSNGFVILAKQLPRNFLIKTHRENAEIGITSMTINYEDRNIFVIGIEGGGIFQCLFDSLVPASYSAFSPISLKSPISMGFERHKGQVTTVQFSPFSRNVFLSAGTDGELRIYSLLQPKPLLMLQLPTGGINNAQWSPIRPLVFSCVSNNGQFHVWDLKADEKSPIESIPVTAAKGYGLSLQNNNKNPSLLATSCSDGTVQVWELSGSVLMVENGEELQLQALSKNID
ncbi:WD repeat-containing protein 34 [Nephila pilipes]|uniref:WD repeat-containing protein 34 n=1 Tax=Nephila pilipes TaxID=299642 RepID=A0A8X6PIM8_NEPPI|nr:WD repeat-containing protein 34 [Nephila pilipes]